MEKLTNREEDIIRVLWRLKKAFVNDILNNLPEPKPHYNTISTIIRKMEEKGYVKYKAFGKTHQYYPVVSEEKYKKTSLTKTVEHYFENSYKEMVSFFAKDEKISVKDLQEIIQMIETNNKK